ncbi:hypothetical protein VPNG_07227 [Cytospora leucostoma]|uniref:Amidohydrolase-related domain-containing protein n=1 Tax=Cytospora leucostoma TaxID=1230097 RepID=A0A423WKL1_9PEZI|nr:hypothetical protein VPNG_07227 [Cytospora leucostoma]
MDPSQNAAPGTDIYEQPSSDSDTFRKPCTLPKQQEYVFVNINIVDPVEGKILPGRTVHIANGKVVSTELSTTLDYMHSTGERAIFIDSVGKYLCPGLIDAHVHLYSVPGSADLNSSMATPAAVSYFRQPFQCKAMLERGYTTARDCGGATLALKEAIAEGVFPGPRLFIAGQALSQTGGHGDRRLAHESAAGTGCCEQEGLSTVVDGVPSVLQAARNQFRQGADFLKIMVGGGVASPTDKLTNVQFTAEEIRAATDVASSYDTFATAHAYTPKAIRRAIENGVRGIEHGNFIDADTARFMADHGVYLTPTLVTYQAMADPKYAAFLPRENQEKNKQVLEQGLQSIKIAHDAGVKLCLGSDLLSLLGVEQLKEFGLRAGVLGSAEVLRHATVNPAKMLGQEDRLGRVKEGFLADLLVLNGNPLEDITILERPDEHLLAVIKEGRVYSSRWSKLPVDVYERAKLIE